MLVLLPQNWLDLLLLKLLVSLLNLFHTFLPVLVKELHNLLLDGLESLSLQLFQSVLSLAHISSFNLFIHLLSSRSSRHLSSAHFAVRITHGVDVGTNHTLPLHQHTLFFFLLLLLLLFFLYLLHDLFLHKLSNIPSLHTNNHFVTFGINIVFRG